MDWSFLATRLVPFANLLSCLHLEHIDVWPCRMHGLLDEVGSKLDWNGVLGRLEPGGSRSSRGLPSKSTTARAQIYSLALA